MSSYNFDSVVSKSEADALKDMIFKRVRERAAQLNEDTQNSYSSSIRNDVMDMARDSFVSSHNPFSVKTEEPKIEKTISTDKNREISIAQKNVDELKSQLYQRSRTENENLVKSETEANMAEARASLSNKKGFMGALEFLNSQASISLVKQHGTNFEAVA